MVVKGELESAVAVVRPPGLISFILFYFIFFYFIPKLISFSIYFYFDLFLSFKI